ncbi:hypothetical protein QBC45DRAFT_429071 [Copromyces sp. CBS 386.78]|nr:hypothetical protein QBC45DRAFT_429071 [Copromyces sp. CBS 386.78]
MYKISVGQGVEHEPIGIERLFTFSQLSTTAAESAQGTQKMGIEMDHGLSRCRCQPILQDCWYIIAACGKNHGDGIRVPSPWTTGPGHPCGRQAREAFAGVTSHGMLRIAALASVLVARSSFLAASLYVFTGSVLFSQTSSLATRRTFSCVDDDGERFIFKLSSRNPHRDDDEHDDNLINPASTFIATGEAQSSSGTPGVL